MNPLEFLRKGLRYFIGQRVISLEDGPTYGLAGRRAGTGLADQVDRGGAGSHP